jgi:hypothetical protein
MIGLAADGSVDSPASFGVAGTVGAVIVALGFAAASRCRLLPQRSHKHRVRLVFLSIAVGGAVGLVNLAANWAITEVHPALRALLVERIIGQSPERRPMTERVFGVRPFSHYRADNEKKGRTPNYGILSPPGLRPSSPRR